VTDSKCAVYMLSSSDSAGADTEDNGLGMDCDMINSHLSEYMQSSDEGRNMI
jgi:hypothetical protein